MTPSESKGSIEKVASSYSLETNVKGEPFETDGELHSLSISTCEQNIVKILKSTTKHKSHWCNVQSDWENSLSALLGLQFNLYETVMKEMKLHSLTKTNKKFVPNQNLIESWLQKCDIEGTLLQHRRKGSERQLHVRLGTPSTHMSLQEQLKKDMQPPKMQHNMHLTPAVERLHSRKPIEAPAEELTLESETAIGSDIMLPSTPNPLIESPVEEPELMLEPPATEPLSFEAEFENLLKKHFPIKSQHVDESNWCDVEVPLLSRQTKNETSKPTILLLKCSCDNNKNTAIKFLECMLSVKFHQNDVALGSVEVNIARNVHSYFTRLIKETTTKKRKSIQDAIDKIYKASVNDNPTNNEDVSKCFGMHDDNSYYNLPVAERRTKVRKDNVHDVAKQCVDEFVHGDECTRIDANQFKFKEIAGEKHPIRIWNQTCWSRRLEIFNKSEARNKNEQQCPSLAISETRLKQFICPCVKNPTSDSCVDVPISALTSVMHSLATFLRRNSDLKDALKECSCEFHSKCKIFEKMCNSRPEELIELTLCNRVAQPCLACENKIPKLHHPNCVNAVCCNCSNVNVSSCPMHSQCAEKAKCILWQEAERAGGKTQLEPVENHLPINKIVCELEDCAKTARRNYVLGKWSNHVRKIDLTESDESTTVTLADFSASLDLKARQTDNCSVNNHVVLGMFYLLNNFRKIRLDDNNYACICDTHCFAYFGCSISSGKKNDHVFHIGCLEKMLEKESKIREDDNLCLRKKTIMWTDNCSAQCECRQNFLFIAKKRGESFCHKFATKFHFKGPWDGCGKRLKKHVWDSELQENR